MEWRADIGKLLRACPYKVGLRLQDPGWLGLGLAYLDMELGWSWESFIVNVNGSVVKYFYTHFNSPLDEVFTLILCAAQRALRAQHVLRAVEC